MKKVAPVGGVLGGPSVSNSGQMDRDQQREDRVDRVLFIGCQIQGAHRCTCVGLSDNGEVAWACRGSGGSHGSKDGWLQHVWQECSSQGHGGSAVMAVRVVACGISE